MFPLARGAGTLDEVFVMDGQSPIIPAPANVQAAIDALRPMTADCQVFAPVGDPLAVAIADLEPDTPATRGAIGDAINALLLRDAQLGGTLWLKRLTAAISDAGGVESFNLILRQRTWCRRLVTYPSLRR